MKNARPVVALACALSGLAISSAVADESLNLEGATLSLQPAAKADAPTTQPAGHRGAYGEAGTMWWTIGGGVASDFDTSDDYNLHVAWSWFLVDRLEWGLEGGAWYFDQEGSNEWGASAHMLFRWHFWMSEDRKWSIFADAGIGLLAATGDVPPGGTSFDFMPRVGAGFTHEIAENTRLEAGVRWHHISNARINGDNENPSRDGVLLYTGVIFPF
ncbi:MAG: acyloxyacyl hydrolase [Planctomycetota bacterium]|nr:acyloxyacyl hydrolase [Planctomycetota bacterium]